MRKLINNLSELGVFVIFVALFIESYYKLMHNDTELSDLLKDGTMMIFAAIGISLMVLKQHISIVIKKQQQENKKHGERKE